MYSQILLAVSGTQQTILRAAEVLYDFLSVEKFERENLQK